MRGPRLFRLCRLLCCIDAPTYLSEGEPTVDLSLANHSGAVVTPSGDSGHKSVEVLNMVVGTHVPTLACAQQCKHLAGPGGRSSKLASVCLQSVSKENAFCVGQSTFLQYKGPT